VLKLCRRVTGSNLVDMGPGCSARPSLLFWRRSTPIPVCDAGREAMVNVCGVAMAMLPEQIWVPTWPIDFT
jgi:hypothetical protein